MTKRKNLLADSASFETEFAAFWDIYPRRVAKIDARKAFAQARRLATADEILAGVARYLAHLPDDIRFLPYPATWLRAGRWMDELDADIGGRLSAQTAVGRALDDLDRQLGKQSK